MLRESYGLHSQSADGIPNLEVTIKDGKGPKKVRGREERVGGLFGGFLQRHTLIADAVYEGPSSSPPHRLRNAVQNRCKAKLDFTGNLDGRSSHSTLAPAGCSSTAGRAGWLEQE